MAITKKNKNGAKLLCVPCGRELIITKEGVSNTAIWCCGKPMKTTFTAKKKTIKKGKKILKKKKKK